MDTKELFIKADQHFGQLVDKIKDDQWDNSTPDTEWSVRDLVNHLVGEGLWLPELLAGKTIAEVGDKYDGDVLGANPKEAWAKSSKAAQDATKKLADLEQVVHLSFGDLPAKEYINQMIIDRVIHGWDLAQGLKIEASVPEELATAAYDLLEPHAAEWRSGGAFGPEVQVEDGADKLTKLLALSGRKS